MNQTLKIIGILGAGEALFVEQALNVQRQHSSTYWSQFGP